MKFWAKIAAFFKRLRATVFGNLVVDAALQVVSTIGPDLVDAFAKIAEAKILEVEKRFAGEDGDKKRNEVISYLMAMATERGIQITRSTLNYILETVIASLKADGRL